MTENVVTSTAVPTNLDANQFVVVYTSAGGIPTANFHYNQTFEQVIERYERYSVLDKSRPTIQLLARIGENVYDPFNIIHNLLNGECPWSKQQWFTENYDRWVHHLPRASKTLEGGLAYYQSEEKRSRVVETPIKPGRYLRKFFSDLLTEDEIQEHAIAWSEWATPPELKITQNADEIETLYVDGPHSCMAYGADHFEGKCHPARVYAGPDLAVAYIGDLHDPVARAVVWPERKIHSDPYGDHHRMLLALHRAGYQEESVAGARIQRIFDNRINAYVVPYVDGPCRARDDGDYLILGEGPIYTQYTNGTSEEDPERIVNCEECDEGFPEDELIFIPSMEMSCCPSCTDELTFVCDATYDRHPIEDVRLGLYGRQYGPDAQVTLCDRSGIYYPNRTYNFFTMSNGETWAEHEFEAHGYTDDEGVHHPNPDTLSEAA